MQPVQSSTLKVSENRSEALRTAPADLDARWSLGIHEGLTKKHPSTRRAVAALGLTALLPAAACSRADTPVQVDPKQEWQTRAPDAPGRQSPALRPAWESFVAARGGIAPSVRWSEHGTPSTLMGELSAPDTIVSSADVEAWMGRSAALFGWREDASDLFLRAQVESPMGRHFTFEQRVDGVVVHGAEVKVHVDRRGTVVAVNNGYVPAIALPTLVPTFPSARAIDVATERLPSRDRAPVEEHRPTAELVVDASHGTPTLAWRVVVVTERRTWEAFVDATSGRMRGEPVDLNRYGGAGDAVDGKGADAGSAKGGKGGTGGGTGGGNVSGTGKVFNVNAVVATQNNNLVDANDAATAVPSTAYATVTLLGLDGTGKLDGKFASGSGSRRRVSVTSNKFLFERNTSGFNETMGYHYIDYTQRYIQSLGFTTVNNRRQVFSVDRLADDNSYYSPSTKAITFGIGGVDDAEDAEVIVHEYGHSIQDNQVVNYGLTAQGGAMGEGFGDYLAGSVLAQLSGGFQDTCIADWDAVSYTSGTPHCLRRLDSTKHFPEAWVNEVHDDGEMWSATLWQIRGALGAAVADKVVLQSHFLLTSSANFSDGANALVTAAIGLGLSPTDVETVRSLLKARRFTVTA
jgi:hypothetical protein